MTELQKLMRVRFEVPCEDYRPVRWPIKYPYWCSGTTDSSSVLVAYTESLLQLLEYWPDAINVDVMDPDATISFSGRFPRPDWYTGPATIIVHSNRPLTVLELIMLNSSKHMLTKRHVFSASPVTEFHRTAMRMAADLGMPVRLEGDYKLVCPDPENTYLVWTCPDGNTDTATEEHAS